MGVTSMCWSRKGKQLAVGDSTGSLRQIDLEGNVKNIIPMPSELTSKNLMVQHILWLEDMKFILRYSLEDNKSFQTFLVTQSGTLKSGRSTNYKALPPCSISLWKNTSDQRDGRQCPRVWAAANFAGTGIEFFCEVNGEWCVFNACCGTNLPLDQSDSVASLALDFSEEQPNSNHQSPRIFILSKSCSMFYFSLRDIVCRQVPFTVEVNAANPADQKGTESSYKATECTYADPSLARNESRSAPVVSTPTVIFGQTSGFGTVMSPKRGFPSVTSNSAFEQAYINKLGFFTASNNGTEGISVFGGSTQQLCFKGAPFSSYRESGSSER
ncbi:hypothetical protein BDR26DRAFT_859756 [Obelidium mucronatum]|nr:hypothetical protein BDR26DRAFT_859756 [Obelidium mucronatum]